MDRHSGGLAARAGVNYQIIAKWVGNFDAKYVQFEAGNIRVSGGALAGTEVTDLGVNP